MATFTQDIKKQYEEKKKMIKLLVTEMNILLGSVTPQQAEKNVGQHSTFIPYKPQIFYVFVAMFDGLDD